jgi:ATP-GRASP peptide maturase of grasp-with-spasm system
MILIFSSAGDLSTDEIQHWLLHYKFKNHRLNENDKITELALGINRNILKYNSLTIDLDQIKSVFFRRTGGLNFKLNIKSDPFNVAYDRYLKDYELKSIFDYLNQKIKKKNYVNSFEDVENKKLEYLVKAHELEITVPDWIVSDNWNEINEFIFNYEVVITKPLSMPYFNYIENQNLVEIFYSTKVIKKSQLDNIKQKIKKIKLLPSFFQQYISKRFEIRVFYFDNKFYSMAIFSQQSKKTKFDYRNYDRINPNSLTPFKLPKGIESKLKSLINHFDYTSCSIDLIYANDGLFYFLEINPIGQFKWLNDSCNYYIDQYIAKYLGQNI